MDFFSWAWFIHYNLVAELVEMRESGRNSKRKPGMETNGRSLMKFAKLLARKHVEFNVVKWHVSLRVNWESINKVSEWKFRGAFKRSVTLRFQVEDFYRLKIKLKLIKPKLILINVLLIKSDSHDKHDVTLFTNFLTINFKINKRISRDWDQFHAQ